jgi:pilus assembly protein CpaC
MKRLILLLAAGIMASLIVMAGIGAVRGQEKAEARFDGAVAPRRIAMEVGMSRIIELPQDAAEIFVANPRIANAVVRSPRRLYVIGMETGQTSVVALDQQPASIANSAAGLSPSCRRLFPGLRPPCSRSATLFIARGCMRVPL